MRVDAKFTLALANEHLYSVPYNKVEPRWLRLHTEASLAHAETLPPAEAIQVLDRAIIVAGPSSALFDLIKAKQADLPLEPLITPPTSGRVSDSLVAAKKRIPRQPPGPYITRADWPAMTKWRDANYLLGIAGPGRHVPVEVGRAYDDAGWTQKIVPFADFLQRAWGGSGPPMYLAQYDLLRQMPELQRDIMMPDQVWESDVDPMINVWMGSGGGELISPAHTVCPFNDTLIVGPMEQLLHPSRRPQTRVAGTPRNSHGGARRVHEEYI
jgi:lysine-specific demethylase 8